MRTVVDRSGSVCRLLISSGVLFALTAACSGLCRAEGAVQEPPRERMAEQQFKNIKVFQGLPASQVMPAMSYMRASLGVQCSFCHVEREFDKDGKEEKESARKMILMVREINSANFGGRSEVTCNTCHNGRPHPVSVPSFADISGKTVPPAPVAERTPTEPLPPVSQVLDKYLQAVGGQNVLEKIKTLVMVGTRTTSEGSSAPLEVYQKAPDKMLAAYKLGSAFNTGFNGTIGWVQSSLGLRELEGQNLMRLKQEAEFSPLRLREDYQNLRVIGKQPIGDRQAFVVQGIPKASHSPERFLFDVESGLLLRISARDASPLGPLPVETDFDDYRDVGGVKLPFTVLHLSADHSYRDVYSEITLNVQIDDTKFDKPAVPPK